MFLNSRNIPLISAQLNMLLSKDNRWQKGLQKQL